MTAGLIIFCALLVGFTVQTVLGFAAGLVSLPILLFQFEVAEAVAIVSIFNLAFSGLQVWRNRENIDFNVYLELGPGTLVGVVLGVWLLSFGKPLILKKALGVFVLAYVAYRFTKKKQITPNKMAAFALSLLGGFFAGLFSSGAPPYVIYCSSKYSDAIKLRANMIAALSMTNLLRFIGLILTGILSAQIFQQALWGVPSIILATFLGERLFARIDKEVFMKMVLVFLSISGLLMLI